VISSLLRGRTRGFGLGAVVAAAWLLFGASPASAQQGAITGTVTDAGTGSPVSGAQVFVAGTQLGTLTNQDGSYRLEGVPTGQQTVRVRLIGYQRASRTVDVSAGQAATADFQLSQTALKLQEVVVTGVAGETPETKLPFTVGQLDAEEVPVPSSSAGGLLQGKIAGAQVVSPSGQPGEGVSIQLRGATSINASGRSQEPLIVVDGVILGRGMGLADLNSLDIQNIEVVKGAAAASLYGSRAQNGVVQITTKRGDQQDQGSIDFTVRAEGGQGQLPKEIPLAQYTALRTNASGCPDNCYLDADGNPTSFAGAALDYEDGFPNANTWTVFQDNAFPEATTYDQVDRFFDPGDNWSLYGAATGRMQNTNFRVSAEYYEEQGIIRHETGYDRKNVRLNLDNSPSDDLDFQVSGFYSSAMQDQAPGTAFFGLTFMAPNVDLTETDENGDLLIVPDPRSIEANPLYLTKNQDDTQSRQRVMGSGRVTWSPLTWLSLEGTFSYDRSDNSDRFYEFEGFKQTDPPETPGPGSLDMDTDVSEALNAKFLATVTQTFGDLTSRTRAQALAERQHNEGFNASGSEFAVQNTPTLNALVGSKNIGSYEQNIRSMGFYLIEALDYKDRYIVDGLIRRDGSSLFGDERRWHTYYRGSAAWRVAQEPWWPAPDALGEFKLRGSYGTAGSRPNFSAQYETYGITSGGSVVPQTLGNSQLEPEFAKELEVGANMVFFDRVSLDLTYAESDIEDQILNVPLPGYYGFDSQWRNAGALHTETWEASLQTSVVQTPEASWTLNVNFDKSEQEITQLDVPPYQWGPKNAFFNREGEKLGTMYGTRFATSCGDLPQGTDCSQFQVNDDGYLVWVGEGNSWQDGFANSLWGTSGTVNGNTYTWGSPFAAVNDEGESFLPMGSTTPDFNLSMGNNITYKGFQLYGLLDASVGHEIYNQTLQWAYRERRAGAVDQAGKPQGMKKPTEYYRTLYAVNAPSSEFIEDASYLKLRELSLTYSFSDDLLQSAFGSVVEGASINLVGRNLVTWTDFRGYDPEVGFSGGQSGSAAIGRFDNYNYPNFRTITGTVQLTF